MNDAEGSSLSIHESCSIRAVRVIPFDIGYDIDTKIRDRIISIGNTILIDAEHNKRVFGASAILYGKSRDNLELFVFEDGIGVFIYTEEPVVYKDYDSIDCDGILCDRRAAHRGILSGAHAISNNINQAIGLLRNALPDKLRRSTSLTTWEHDGLSYVFSFYLVDTACENLSNEILQKKIYRLLYPDEHTFGSESSNDQIESALQKILDDKDPIGDVHLAVSWATVLILGRDVDKHLTYYSEFEAALQHIWLYAYITEKIIDEYFTLTNRQTSSKSLSSFYDSDMDNGPRT